MAHTKPVLPTVVSTIVHNFSVVFSSISKRELISQKPEINSATPGMEAMIPYSNTGDYYDQAADHVKAFLNLPYPCHLEHNSKAAAYLSYCSANALEHSAQLPVKEFFPLLREETPPDHHMRIPCPIFYRGRYRISPGAHQCGHTISIKQGAHLCGNPRTVYSRGRSSLVFRRPIHQVCLKVSSRDSSNRFVKLLRPIPIVEVLCRIAAVLGVITPVTPSPRIPELIPTIAR